MFPLLTSKMKQECQRRLVLQCAYETYSYSKSFVQLRYTEVLLKT